MATRVPLERQVALLPAPEEPRVWWIDLDTITLCARAQDYLECRVRPWAFCSTLERKDAQERISIFEEAPPDDGAWATHETIRRMFLFGEDYHYTPQYIHMVEYIEVHGVHPWTNARSVEDVERYFERLVRAYHSMAEHGWLPQSSLGGRNGDEMPLYIAEDGSLVKLGGANHRIRMAEILGIRYAPCYVRGANASWLAGVCRETGLPPHRALESWIVESGLLRDSVPECSTPRGGGNELRATGAHGVRPGLVESDRGGVCK